MITNHRVAYIFVEIQQVNIRGHHIIMEWVFIILFLLGFMLQGEATNVEDMSRHIFQAKPRHHLHISPGEDLGEALE